MLLDCVPPASVVSTPETGVFSLTGWSSIHLFLPSFSLPSCWIPVCHEEWWQNLIWTRPQSNGVRLRTWTWVKPKAEGRVEIGCLVNSKPPSVWTLKTCYQRWAPSAVFLNSSSRLCQLVLLSVICSVILLKVSWQFECRSECNIKSPLAQPVAKLDILSTHQPPGLQRNCKLCLPSTSQKHSFCLHITPRSTGGMQALPTQHIPRDFRAGGTSWCPEYIQARLTMIINHFTQANMKVGLNFPQIHMAFFLLLTTSSQLQWPDPSA